MCFFAYRLRIKPDESRAAGQVKAIFAPEKLPQKIVL